MYKFILTLLILSYSHLGFAQDKSTRYIDQYKDLAISEMHRTGIPASIKLAQGLLESGAGTSELALQANNHFGIKCGGSWTGKTYGVKDDEFKNGKKIKSCFRVFDSAHQSFIEHSHFLTDQKRYAFLFSYSNRDYYAWAKGLRKAGYATDKKYPSKLINLINKYQLFLYDDVKEGDTRILASNDPPPATKLPEKNTSNKASQVVVVEHNSTRKNKNTTAEVVMTSPKKQRTKSKSKRVNKESKYHIVEEGQSIRDIARIYDLDKTTLRLRNRIPRDAEPLSGEKLLLRDKISIFSRPQFTRQATASRKTDKDEYIF